MNPENNYELMWKYDTNISLVLEESQRHSVGKDRLSKGEIMKEME